MSGIMYKPYVVFFTDAGISMGTGHVMRCVALGSFLVSRGASVFMVGKINDSYLEEKAHESGIRIIEIQSELGDFEAHLNFFQETVSRLPSGTLIWAVCDGYHFTYDFHKKLSYSGAKLLVIDDFIHLANYHADLILNQNLGVDFFRYPENIKVLAGPKYALIRREFLGRAICDRDFRFPVKKILVTLGGSDPGNVTLKILENLASIDAGFKEIRVVIGSQNCHSKIISSFVASVDFRCKIIQPAKDMPSLMEWADFVISAGGTTCLELAYMGVPFLTFTLSENQEKATFELEKAGVAPSVGWPDISGMERFRELMRQIFTDCDMRRSFSKKGRILVDGLGGERVAGMMLSSGIHFRQMCQDDCMEVFKMVNDPEIRSVSFSTGLIPYDAHEEWFSERLLSPDCYFFMVLVESGLAAGYVRFESKKDKDENVISVALTPEFRGKGLGFVAIQQSSMLFLNMSEARTITAYVRSDNKRSLKSFQKAGFAVVADLKNKGVHTIKLAYEKHNHESTRI